jgi:hypothetical protein
MCAMIEKFRMSSGDVAPGRLGFGPDGGGTGRSLLRGCGLLADEWVRVFIVPCRVGHDCRMTQPPKDTRAVIEYRVPACDLRAGDLVNTSPGGDDDWQQVISVHTSSNLGTDAEVTGLVNEIGDRYVVVRLTDVAPVDSPVYFDNGHAMLYGADAEPDQRVTEVVSDTTAVRTFLYTRYELVTVRS